MTDKTIITLFSGGELAGVGARSAGYVHIGGVELDPKIAGVAKQNGFDLTVGDILNVNPHDFQTPLLLHASPVCTRASLANNKRGEQALDIAMGDKTADFIRALLPKLFTMENVPQYKDFEAFKRILRALDDSGYFYHFENLDAADFGVPQSRRRLVLRAVRNGWVPHLPQPVKHVGWYESIEDLIPTLPISYLKKGMACPYDPQGLECRKSEYCRGHFAEWQEKRLPEDFQTTLFSQQGYNNTIGKAEKSQPAKTITGQHNQLSLRAFLVGGNDKRVPVIAQDDPSFTLSVTGSKHPNRAFLVGGANTSDVQAAPGVGVSEDKEPSRVVAGNALSWRAYKKQIDHVESDEPSFTVKASIFKQPSRAGLDSGIVVKLTPRALARFQSIPDSYILPDNNTLSGQIIGNGFPCLMYQRIVESFEGAI